VPAGAGVVVDLNISIPHVIHTWANDVDMILVGPTGLMCTLISDVGASTSWDISKVYTLDQAAAAALGTTDATTVSGTYRPTNISIFNDPYVAPGPGSPVQNPPSLNVFNGTPASGNWNLYIVDDVGGDVGSMNSGWGMTLVAGASCTDPLPAFCPSNVDDTGASATTVDVLDLLKVITTWGVSGPPRPDADCAPLPNGDCTVDVLDLLGVITTWGSCFPPTGRCCANVCLDGITSADCTTLGGVWGGADTTCTGFVCPVLNNEPAGAFPLVLGNFPNTSCNLGNSTGATTTTNPAGPSCTVGGPATQTRDVWWKYTVPTTPDLVGQILRINTCSNVAPFTDTVLSAYVGTVSPLALTEIACNDDAGAGCGVSTLLSRIETTMLNPGQTVYIRLGSWSTGATNAGAYQLCGSIEDITADDCVGAETIAVGGSDTSNLLDATQDFGPTCGGVTSGRGKWYKFQGTGQTVRISTCTSTSDVYDGQIIVYCAGAFGCGALNCVASSNIDHGLQNQPPVAPYWPCTAFQGEVVDICTNVNNLYYVQIGTIATGLPGGIAGEYTLTIASLGAGCIAAPAGYPARPNLSQAQCEAGSPPLYDLCTSGIVANVGNTSFNNSIATPQTAGPGTMCGQPWSKDVFFRYTSANGGSITVSTMSSPVFWDSVLEVYNGIGCAPFGAVMACSDDFTTVGGLSQVTFTGTAGTTYLIRVASWNTSGGNQGTLTITDP